MACNGVTVDPDKPLREQCADALDQEMEGVLIGEATTVRNICDKLRRLRFYRCGFRHENWDWNPSKQPCSELARDYNVGCTHSLSNELFQTAKLVSIVMGKRREGEQLYREFFIFYTDIDDVDAHCRPLYQLSMDGTTSRFPNAEYSMGRLGELGIETNPSAGRPSDVQEHLRVFQDTRAKKILELRDRFLALLGA